MTDTPRVFLAAYHDGLSPRYEVVPEGAMGAEPWVPEDAGGWQPIETAPKDGTSVLGYWTYTWSDNHYIQPVRYLHDKWLHDWDHSDEIKPTHWQPLPAPPGPHDGGTPTSGAYDLICCTAEDVATGRGFSGDAAADLAMAQESLRVALALVGWKG